MLDAVCGAVLAEKKCDSVVKAVEAFLVCTEPEPAFDMFGMLTMMKFPDVKQQVRKRNLSCLGKHLLIISP